MAALPETYARYDRDDLQRALGVTMDVFERFERETVARLGFRPPPDRGPIRSLVRDLLAD